MTCRDYRASPGFTRQSGMSEPRPEAATRTTPSGFGGGAASTFAVTGFGAASRVCICSCICVRCGRTIGCSIRVPRSTSAMWGVVLRVVCFVSRRGRAGNGLRSRQCRRMARSVRAGLGRRAAGAAAVGSSWPACSGVFLVRLPAALQWMSAVVLGGVCGAAGWAQLWFSGLTSPPGFGCVGRLGFLGLVRRRQLAGIRRRGCCLRGGHLLVAHIACPHTASRRSGGTPCRTAVAHQTALPVQHAQQRDRPGRVSIRPVPKACWKIWQSCFEWR